MPTLPTKYIVPLLITFGAAFLVNSCKERDCGDPEYFALKQLDKYVPYKGIETLRFLHNNADTQYFAGEGLRKFVVTTHPAKEDGGECSEQHESASIQFSNSRKNIATKVEYIYDRIEFGSAQYAPDPYTYLRLWYNMRSCNPSFIAARDFFLNGVNYGPVTYFTEKDDDTTGRYIIYSFSSDIAKKGIIKIKYPGDTLILIP